MDRIKRIGNEHVTDIIQDEEKGGRNGTELLLEDSTSCSIHGHHWENIGCMNLVLSAAVLFSQQQHCSLFLRCITMCENNVELSGFEDEQNRNMWYGVLSLITDYSTGPWIQLCPGDEELARTALTCRYAVDCLCAELYAL